VSNGCLDAGNGNPAVDAGGSSNPACDQLTAAYAAAFTAALACTPGAPNQCQALVPQSPVACPTRQCQAYAVVNDGAQVRAVLETWLDTCASLAETCPDGAPICVPVEPSGNARLAASTCVPNGQDASTGMCRYAPGVLAKGGADGGVSCDDIGSRYRAALQAARACTPGAPDQCRAIVSDDPHNCPAPGQGTQAYVSDGAQVEAVRQMWLASCEDAPDDVGCLSVRPGTPPPPSSCVPTAPDASTGACTPEGPDAGAPAATDGGESCDQLAADYAAAVTAARACTPGAPSQCQAHAQSAVPYRCACQPFVAVNDWSVVNGPWQSWSARCLPACAGYACGPASPPPAVCVPVDGGSPTGGFCMPR
jgi:hypothetical protein